MQSHEYRVVPAPRKGLKAKGVRTPGARFAHAVEAEMNRMAREGWEYVRTDTLPCERRRGWFGGRETVFETLLVFRRVRAEPQRDAATMPSAVTFPPSGGAAPRAPTATRAIPPAEEPLPGVLRLMEPGPDGDRSRLAAE